MGDANFCTQCGVHIQDAWKFCKSCGSSLELVQEPTATGGSPQNLMSQHEDSLAEVKPSSKSSNKEVDAAAVAGVGILAVVLLIVGIYFANRVDPEDFVTRLNEVSEFYWEEDPTAPLAISERFSALRGFFGDKCNVYIYDTEEKALDTAKNYLTPQMYWWGTDDKTGYGVVIADQGKDSPCTDQAAEAFGWTLEH